MNWSLPITAASRRATRAPPGADLAPSFAALQDSSVDADSRNLQSLNSVVVGDDQPTGTAGRIPELRRAEGDGGELRCRLQARDHEPQRTADSLCDRGPADMAIVVADRLDWHWPLTAVTRASR